MRRWFTVSLLVFASLGSLRAAGPEEEVDLGMMTRIREEGFSNSKVMDTAEELTDVLQAHDRALARLLGEGQAPFAFGVVDNLSEPLLPPLLAVLRGYLGPRELRLRVDQQVEIIHRPAGSLAAQGGELLAVASAQARNRSGRRLALELHDDGPVLKRVRHGADGGECLRRPGRRGRRTGARPQGRPRPREVRLSRRPTPARG